jgi:deoxyribodipyrimidine photo-lyase
MNCDRFDLKRLSTQQSSDDFGCILKEVKKMEQKISLVWFRQDLRLSDQQALSFAAKTSHQIFALYIFDDCAPSGFQMGACSRLWLHDSLKALCQSLNQKLNFYAGAAEKVMALLLQKYPITNIFWNTCFEPWLQEQEQRVKAVCQKYSCKVQVFNSNYLWWPQEINKKEGGFYKVFTAYKKKAETVQHRLPCSPWRSSFDSLQFVQDPTNKTTLSSFQLCPQTASWHQKIQKRWVAGEEAAHKKWNFFIAHGLKNYKEGRNFPAQDHVSLLSSHLHFGEISPAFLLSSLAEVAAPSQDREHFKNELFWREFSCSLLFYFPSLYFSQFNSKFNSFPWQVNAHLLKMWQKGLTGYPFVDAGMRQLWQTGYLHNRVRMVVASFLVKNLNIPWQAGRDWFWDCLLDADLANNSASWQWVAGCGVDAAPYFRIFNPITQGEKFDSQGVYTKQFLPELQKMPAKYLFKPWLAPKSILQSAGVELGKTYPYPLVDLGSTRLAALERYGNL